MNMDELLGALAGTPILPGARCRGRPHLFDAAPPGEPDEVTEARHLQALGLCRACPALARCGDYLISLPPSKRPSGVIAGQIRRERPNRNRTTGGHPMKTPDHARPELDGGTQ